MKKELAVLLLLILATSFRIKAAHQHCQPCYTPLTRTFCLEFDRASRTNVAQTSNQFSVHFNGIKIKDYLPGDYEIHHQKFNLKSKVGKNSIGFKGTGISDSYGQTIDNVKLHRKSFCGYQDVIVNGGFEQGHNLGTGWAIFANGVIPGWKSDCNQIEIGYGKIYNNRWPETRVCELDAKKNSNNYQEFTLDKWYRLV